MRVYDLGVSPPVKSAKAGPLKPQFNGVKKIILTHPAYDGSEKILKAVKNIE